MLNPNTNSLQTLLKSSQQKNISQLRLREENVPECKAWKKHIRSKESSVALFLMNMDEKCPQNLVTNEMQQYMKKKIMTKWDFFFPRKGSFYNSPGLINTTPMCDVWWGVYTSFLIQPRLSEKVNSTGNGLEQVDLWHVCREQPFPRLNGVRVRELTEHKQTAGIHTPPIPLLFIKGMIFWVPASTFPKWWTVTWNHSQINTFFPSAVSCLDVLIILTEKKLGHCLSQVSGRSHVDTTVNMGGFKKKLNKIIYSLIYCCSEKELLVCPSHPASLHQK